jgi:uncharacterized protein YbjT (DUF2867 family)
MKTYVITGSVGHISKPIIMGLVKAGNEVRVITTAKDRVKEIETLGAKAHVGQVQDASFVMQSFNGADVVYTMIPPIWQTNDWRASQNEVARNYRDAIRENRVKHVVNLSSVGAHAGNGVGPVDGLFDFEQLLNAIPDLHVKHLRPSFFFYNFFSQIGLIKHAGIIGGNYGDGEKIFLVHTNDIAVAALEELRSLAFTGSSVRYVIGDERSGNDIAKILGAAIGREIKWAVFTDEEQRQGLLQAGLSHTHAKGYTDMGKALREGLMQQDIRKNKPALSATKLDDFAMEFATVFNSQN